MKSEDPLNNPVGRTFGSYLVESQVGAGGMGEVYRARDTRLDRLVAIKLLPIAVASDPERFRRFHVEARAASSLNHPHILVVHDIGESEGRPFIVTELVAGETLRQKMDGRSIAVREAIDIGTQVASALAAAHGRGIVHRDIKPENIMVRPDGYLKVLDFGLAKLSSSKTTGSGRRSAPIPGSSWARPSTCRRSRRPGEEVDFRSDQFAFGVVMYELLSGRRPFQRRFGGPLGGGGHHGYARAAGPPAAGSSATALVGDRALSVEAQGRALPHDRRAASRPGYDSGPDLRCPFTGRGPAGGQSAGRGHEPGGPRR